MTGASVIRVVIGVMGVLLILACSSIAVYGVMLAGWSSGSKYPLLGSVRASAQMVSYEAALGLSVVTVVLLAGSVPRLLPYVLSFAAGSFMYVSMSDLIPGLHRGDSSQNPVRQVLMLALGVATIALL